MTLALEEQGRGEDAVPTLLLCTVVSKGDTDMHDDSRSEDEFWTSDPWLATVLDLHDLRLLRVLPRGPGKLSSTWIFARQDGEEMRVLEDFKHERPMTVPIRHFRARYKYLLHLADEAALTLTIGHPCQRRDTFYDNNTTT